MTNSLHTTALSKYVPMMKVEAEQYFAQWGESGEVDLYQVLQTCCQCAANVLLMCC